MRRQSPQAAKITPALFDPRGLGQRARLLVSLCRLGSLERGGVAALNRAALDHVGIDPHIRVIVLRCRTQNVGILRERGQGPVIRKRTLSPIATV